jgi:hypothetical protein
VPSQIDKIGVFCATIPTLPDLDQPFGEMMAGLDSAARAKHGAVSDGALNNCHGDWYEWLLSFAAWNIHKQLGTRLVAFTIPNVSQFDAAKLYSDELVSMVQHLRDEVSKSANVQLITSNPDFVLANATHVKNNTLPVQITDVNAVIISELDNLYRGFIGVCGYTDIGGYASVKFSLRPDRRLQIAHEGSLMKALYVHLQTRLWIMKPPPLRYYALSPQVGPADRAALRTVATHSITNVGSVPQSAVDDVFETATLRQAMEVFCQILS